MKMGNQGGHLVRVFFDVLVVLLCIGIYQLRHSNSNYENPEFSKPFKGWILYQISETGINLYFQTDK